MFWLHFPAILKGWFKRVFAYGDACALTPEGWGGEAKGRVPLLHHEKALVISTTLFNEADYKADWEAPMTRIIDDWGLRDCLRSPPAGAEAAGYDRCKPVAAGWRAARIVLSRVLTDFHLLEPAFQRPIGRTATFSNSF